METAILIKGVNKPKNCYTCPFLDRYWIDSDGHKNICCISGSDVIYFDDRPAQFCNIEEVKI